MSKLKTSDILKVARTLIESEERYYVCYAIEVAACKLMQPNLSLEKTIRQKEQALLKRIDKALNGSSTVGDWLNTICGVPYKDLNREALLDYRIRWIDELIKEYQSKGD